MSEIGKSMVCDAGTYNPALMSRDMRAIIDRHLERFGVSGSGRDWILRALHPAGDHKSPGLPDQSSTSVLRPDFRMQATIAAPPDAPTWDLYIWTVPGDVNAVYWAKGQSPCDFSADAPPDGTCQVGVLRNQASSDGLEPIVFSANDGSGRFVTTVSSLPNLNAASFRHQFSSITVHQIASAVADQGQVYAAQFPPQIRPTDLVIPVGYVSGVPIPGSEPISFYEYYGSWSTCTLPTNEADLAAMAPQFYMDAAREGAYLPLRLAGPSQPYASATGGMGLAYQDGGAPPYGTPNVPVAMRRLGCVLTPTSQTGSGSASPLIPWPFQCVGMRAQNPIGGGAIIKLDNLMMDTGYDNTNIGVIIFRGLAGANGGGFGASVQLKAVNGLEIAPNPGASDRVFAEVAAPYEPRALEAYYALCLELKDAYPASFNSLSSILDAIKGVASKIWGVVEKPLADVAPHVIRAGLSALGMPLTGARRGEMREPSVPRVTYKAPAPARSSSMLSRRSSTKGLTGVKKGRKRR